MSEMNVKQIIMERTGCPEARAERIEKNLANLCNELRPMLKEWLQTGKESDDTKYEGYSLNDLMRKFDMRFTGAILTLDWLIREPEEAKKALKSGIK